MCVYVYVCLSVCLCSYSTAHLWESENIFRELVLFFHHMGPRDQPLVLWLGTRHLYPLSPITGLSIELYLWGFDFLAPCLDLSPHSALLATLETLRP